MSRLNERLEMTPGQWHVIIVGFMALIFIGVWALVLISMVNRRLRRLDLDAITTAIQIANGDALEQICVAAAQYAQVYAIVAIAEEFGSHEDLLERLQDYPWDSVAAALQVRVDSLKSACIALDKRAAGLRGDATGYVLTVGDPLAGVQAAADEAHRLHKLAARALADHAATRR